MLCEKTIKNSEKRIENEVSGKEVLNNRNRVNLEARFNFIASFIEPDFYNGLLLKVKTELIGV